MDDKIRRIFNYPTDTPLKFWLKYWEWYIKKIIDLDSCSMQLDNPHFILNDVVAEIKYNGFKNGDNRKLFKEMLGKCLKSDVVFSELYNAQCILAFNNWDNSPLYVDSVCVNVLASMERCDYLNAIAKKLIQIIDENESLSESIKTEICLYTNLYISEFICLGVDINDINNFIDEDEIIIAEGGNVIVAPKSCYGLNEEEFSSKDLYYEAIKKRLRERSAEDYINNIIKHFNKQPMDGHVILRLLGLKGSINSYLQGVHIYSVDNITYLKGPRFISKIEEPDNSFQFVNIAVPISHRFFYTSVNIAREKANSILDFLSLNMGREKELSVSKQFAVIEIDGEEYNSMDSFEDDVERARFYRDIQSYDISNIADKLPDYLKEFDNSNRIDNENFRKISNSMHWYKKAICSERYEDKLLYSWIAVESLFKVGEDIKSNIIIKEKERSVLNLTKILSSCVLTRNHFYSYAENAYLNLIAATQHYDNYYDFSSAVIENAKLNLQPGQRIEMSYFLNNLSSMIEEINNEVYKCELVNIQSFYEGKDGLKEFKNMVSNDVTLIYRLRNLIVHNAVCSQFQTKLYAHKAQFLCGSLIQAIRFNCNKYEVDVENALLRIYTDYQIFEAHIDEEIILLKESRQHYENSVK